MKKPLQQYSGQLTAQQVADGMNAATRNARRLYEDAMIMAEAGRYATACALAALSIEESGKLSVLRSLATAKNEVARKTAWREYRTHQAKNFAWIIVDLARQGARTLDDMRPMFDPTSDHPALLDALKQIAIYSDCYGHAHWSEPLKVIDKDLCESIMLAAKVLVPKNETTAREMELFVQHIGNDPSVEGIKAFQLALKAEGLSKHTDEQLERFLGAKMSH
jgi:AbiV family abortive infection protein